MRLSRLFKITAVMAALTLAQPALANQAIENSPKISSDDSALNSLVQSRLAKDTTLTDLKITVSTKDGIVSLVGKVNTDEEARKAIEIAESTPGIKDTDTTHLVIEESKQPIMDTFIIAKVNGVFAREKLFGDKDLSVMSINVDSKNGVVYLTGTADSQNQADNAVKIAKSIKGVTRVDSKIEVVKPGT